MAQLHTFTDFDLLPNQTAALAYGPVVGSEQTDYRITSRFQLTQDLKAYAICDGAVFIHPVTGHSDLVNLIIKPFILDDVNFTPVEYFIYRGLKKSNFVDGSDNLILKTSADKTDLIDEIHDTQTQAVADSAGATDSADRVTGLATSNSLGWDKRTASSTTLKDIFFANDGDNQLAFVNKGDYIGNFSFAASRPIGFEVVLKDRFFNPDLNYFKTLEHIVTATVPGGGVIEGNEDIANMRKREEILNFIDPAAYFSVWREVGVDYKTDGNAATEITDINNLHTNIISKFFTKRTVYIDIRNELGLSLNYYKDNQGKDGTDSNFGKNLLVSVNTPINFTSTSGIEEKYYIDYWPIYSLNTIANTSDDFNDLYLSFRKRFNPKPVVYYDYAFENDLAKAPLNEEKFKRDFNESGNTDWSDEIHIKITNISSLSGATTPCSITKLMVAKFEQPDSTTLPPETFVREHFLDGVFPVVDNLQVFSNSGAQIISSTGKVFINSFYETGVMGIAQTGVGVSTNGVLLFASITDFITNANRLNGISSIDIFNVPSKVSYTGDNEWGLMKSHFFDKIGIEARKFPLTLSGSTQYVSSFYSNGKLTEKTGMFFSIGFSLSQYLTIVAQKNTDTDLNTSHSETKFGINYGGLLSDDNNQKYYSASFKLLGTGASDLFIDKVTTPLVNLYSKNKTSYNV